LTYRAVLSGTSITFPSSITGLGAAPALIGCYGSDGIAFEPGGVSVTGSGDITISSTSGMAGVCIFAGAQSNAAGGEYIASLSGASVNILASTHLLGRYPAVSACYDSSGAWFEPGGIAVDASGDVTISSTSAMSGKCILLGQ
jgi:hypothetical protein